jgi:hypothetical protein
VVPVTVGFVALAFGLRRPRRPLPKKPDGDKRNGTA